MIWLLHVLFIDLWVPIWPNLAASAICFGLTLWRTKVYLRRHHEAMREHVAKVLAEKTEGETNDTVPH